MDKRNSQLKRENKAFTPFLKMRKRSPQEICATLCSSDGILYKRTISLGYYN